MGGPPAAAALKGIALGFAILSKLASSRIIGSFFAYVFGVAIVGGFITQTLIGRSSEANP